MRTRNSTVTTEENYLHSCKNHKMLTIYEKLRKCMFECFDDDVNTGATSYYAHWDFVGSKTRQFAIIYIQKEKIRIETLVPINSYNIGEMVPETHGYALNYRTDIFIESDIELVKGIILESYRQIKLLV